MMMKTTTDRIVCRGLGLLSAMALAFSLCGAALAAPIIDNNAGTWTDTYNDDLGVRTINRARVDARAGVVKLISGWQSATYETVRIKPPSFSAWGTLKLSGTWSSPAHVSVRVINASTRATLLSMSSYNGEISLAGIDPAAHPALAVIVDFTRGAVDPMITDLTVTWTPISVLLLDKSAPWSVQAGQHLVYNIRYSVNYVEARDLVVWDKIPLKADGTMIPPTEHGQNDDVAFVEASQGGVYTTTPVTVHGVEIPAGSVYWDLGTKPEGTTDTLWFTVRTRNGTLNQTRLVNRATAGAANAVTVHSDAIETWIYSHPAPRIVKRPGEGIYTLASGNYTFTDVLNRFTIQARNDYIGEGRETMFGVVVYDDISNLIGKIDPDLGGAGVPVVDISPPGGYYDPAYTPPSGGDPFPAVVWENRPTLGPGAVFTGSFAVRMLGTPPLLEAGSYTNTVWLDSIYTEPVSSSLVVSWPVDETPFGVFAKGDNLDSYFGITALNDDRELFVRPGASYPYGLAVNNSGMVALNDLIFVDRIPDGTTFKSAWFTDPWLQTNAVIYYSTVETVDTNTPPAYGPDNVPADIDVGDADYWSTNPPGNPADVKWVAFYIPAVNSHYAEPGSAGWVDGAPCYAVGYFDVTVSPTLLEPTPCFDKLIINRGHFNAFAYTSLAGGNKVATHLSATNDETTRVAIDKPKLAFSAPGRVTPSVLGEPGQLAYTVNVMNSGTAMAEDVLLEIRWPSVNVNGVRQYIAFDSVSPASIREFDPENGRLVLELGNIAPGKSVPATLKASVGSGLVFGQQLTFFSKATATARCSPAPASDVASAVVRFAPKLKVHKNDVLDLIPSGGTLDYTLALHNVGNAPSRGTFVVDRIPDEMVLVHATGPTGERVWFSSVDNLPPSFLTPTTPINAATIAANFTLGTQDGDIWTSPYGEQTRWIAWEMDQAIGDSKLYPVGGTSVVGMRLKNDLDGPGPGTEGSPEGVQIFNTAGVFSEELLQCICNEVATTVKIAPGILVKKTGPDVVSKGDTFTWTVSYYNNSGADDDTVTITDTLPPDVEFLSAAHTWNQVALANGAPAGNSGQVVPSAVETVADGSTHIVFNIAGDNGYRGANARLLSQEGGTLAITVRAKADLPSNAELLNHVTGTATADGDTTVSSDEHLVLVRNAELRVRKVASPELPVAGDTVTYNVIVANTGQMAARDIVITDVLPEGVSYVTNSAGMLTATYSIGQPVISGGTLTWSAANLNALTKAGLPPGELPALSGDVVLQYKGVVDASVVPGTHLPNRVTVSTSTPEDDLEPNEDEASVDTPYPDPVIVKDGPAVVQSGERFDWNITYYNATRQPGENVYIIDTLPDTDGDGLVDVTFIEQRADGPGAVTAYYHSGSSDATPAFDPAAPLAGGWTADPVVPVQHIAWVIGTLPGLAGPYSIAVTALAVPPAGETAALPAGTPLCNVVEIFVSGKDQNPDNNTDEHTVRTPSNDMALTKTGSTEGGFPGLVPGAEIVYEIVVENTGTEIAYGIEVVDILPDSLQLAADGAEDTLALVNADDEPVFPVDQDGHEINSTVPLTRVLTTNGVAWFLGSTDEGSASYYRNIGILPGQKQRIMLTATVALDVPNDTPIINTATVTIRNRTDAEPLEEYLGNNTDRSETMVYRADVAVRKSVADAKTGDANWTESGSLLTYTIEYNNFGDATARDTVISEIVPDGTTLVSVDNPVGSWVTLFPWPEADARRFEVNLGDIGPHPNKAIPVYYGAETVVKLDNTPEGGIPAGGFGWWDSIGCSLAPIGDVDGDGIPDLIVGAKDNANEIEKSGGAWIIMLNADGTAKAAVELANGRNGIPSGTFKYNDLVGKAVSGLGDVNGDGVPDVIMTQDRDENNSQRSGGAFVVLLNADGTAQSVVELQNGTNGIPAGTFGDVDWASHSLCGGTDMDGDGIPDVFLGSIRRLSFYLMLLNADGTAKEVIHYQPGSNGIPSQPNLTGYCAPIVIGDVDGNGVPDLFVRMHETDNSRGAGCVVLLDTDLTAKSFVRLVNGDGGIPPNYFNAPANAGSTAHPLGDFDGDGVPDLLLGVPNFKGTGGGALIVLLNADGTAKELIALADGMSGIPAGTFHWGEMVRSLAVLGDVDGDGVTDIMLGGWRYTYAATWQSTKQELAAFYLTLLNADGTVKSITRMANGEGGVPAGQMTASSTYLGANGVAVGDINGDGIIDFAAGEPKAERGGAVWIIMPGLVPCSEYERTVFFDGATEVEHRLHAFEDVQAWDKLVASPVLIPPPPPVPPDGEGDPPAQDDPPVQSEPGEVFYSIGRLVNGQPVYDLGRAFMDIPDPLPVGGFDISAIPAEYQDLVVKVTSTGGRPEGVSLHATYVSESWASFTFTVRVDDPIGPGVLPDINNTVTISTVTPESDLSNNSDEADIMVRTADLEVKKSADKVAALAGDLVTFTLAWRNNGQWPAVNAVLTDYLPSGLTFVSSEPAYDSASSYFSPDAGRAFTWNLGDIAPGATGVVTVVASVNSDVDDRTLVNTVRIANDRQETDYTNNEDSAPLAVKQLANVWIEKTGPATVRLGANAVYTLTYGNNGNNAAANVSVIDTLPAGMTFVSANPAPTGSSGQVKTWSLGTLNPGVTGTITVTARVENDFSLYGKPLVNKVRITTSTTEVTVSDNSDDHALDPTVVPASISGTVWHDVDRDGELDAGEKGIPGVIVVLYEDSNGNGVIDPDEEPLDYRETDGNGAYSFSGLTPGNYIVVEIDPPGYRSTGDVDGPNDNQIPVSINAGDRVTGRDFFDARVGVIGDRVWEDLNANGVQDPGEPGLPNVTVRLLNELGETVDTTQTCADGNYLFCECFPDTYVVEVATPQGFVPTDCLCGDDCALDSDIDPQTKCSGPIPLAAGETNLTVDAGFVIPAIVRGYVFLDNDGDLLRNTGDSPVTDVLVRLMVDGVVVASTNTDAVGYYEFGSVPPGVVSVLVSRVNAALVDVPDSDDERRNRALPDAEGVDAVIVHTVASGAGVLDGRPAETLNFGFKDHPLSTAIDIRLHITPEGVMIQLWTVDEAGCGDIVIYAWIDNAWVEVGRVPAWLVVGEGANTYSVAANGLAAGGAYYLKVIDEAGNLHLSPTPVAVDALQVEAVRLDLQHIMLRFNTEPGRRYQVEVSTDLVTWRTEYVSAPTAKGWTPFVAEPFMAGPGTHTEVRVPRNGRARAFFKIKRVER